MLDRPLEKPDAAHPQRQRVEQRAQIIMRVVWSAYVAAIALTLGFQLYNRLPECGDSWACTVTVTKSVIWSIAWPFYWAFYLNG